jgi:hypothetical protein
MSYPGGNGWPEQPQQPQPYQHSHPEPYQQSYPQPYQQSYPQPYQQAYEQDGLYQPYQQYQQYSGYAGGPPSPKKRKNGLLIGGGALVLVIAVGVTRLVVFTGNGDQQAARPVGSAPADPPPQPGTRAPSSNSPAPPNVQPSIAGWQSVSAPAEKVAYDVPPDWKVESPDTLTGFENQSGPLATMHSVATYKDGQACLASPSGSYRTHTGMMKLVDIDPHKASVAASILWANAALEKPAEDRSLPSPLRHRRRSPTARSTLGRRARPSSHCPTSAARRVRSSPPWRSFHLGSSWPRCS